MSGEVEWVGCVEDMLEQEVVIWEVGGQSLVHQTMLYLSANGGENTQKNRVMGAVSTWRFMSANSNEEKKLMVPIVIYNRWLSVSWYGGTFNDWWTSDQTDQA